MKAKKKENIGIRILIYIFSGFVSVLVIVFLCFSLKIKSDLFRKELIDFNCKIPYRVHWNYYGGIIGVSSCSFETESPYEEVVDWYQKRGWWCDGSCEYSFNLNIGPMVFYMWKVVKINQEYDDSSFVRNYSLFEQYGFSFYPVTKHFLNKSPWK